MQRQRIRKPRPLSGVVQRGKFRAEARQFRLFRFFQNRTPTARVAHFRGQQFRLVLNNKKKKKKRKSLGEVGQFKTARGPFEVALIVGVIIPFNDPRRVHSHSSEVHLLQSACRAFCGSARELINKWAANRESNTVFSCVLITK